MKLLTSNFSPFSTRIRIQIRKKQLDIAIEEPTKPALRTPEFADKYPLAKIPVLELDDGTSISESWAIMEYLEAAFPESSLRPSEPLAIAHINMMARYADLHLGPALFPMFVALLMNTPLDEAKEIAAIKKELTKGENLLATLPDFTKREVNIGDIALATSLLFTLETPKVFGYENILDDFTKLSAWWDWVNQDTEVKNGMNEMSAAFQGFLSTRK